MKITLNGESFVCGNVALTTGYNMQCKTVIIKTKLCYDITDGRFYSEDKYGKVALTPSDLKDFFVDTPVNKLKLKVCIKLSEN